MYDLKTAIASIEKNGFYVLKSALMREHPLL